MKVRQNLERKITGKKGASHKFDESFQQHPSINFSSLFYCQTYWYQKNNILIFYITASFFFINKTRRLRDWIYWIPGSPPLALDILAISFLNFAIVSLARVNFSFRSATSVLILFLASVIALSVDSFLASTGK